MSLKLGNVGSLLSSMLYSDVMKIYRQEPVMIGDGTTRLTQIVLDEPLYEGIQCRISFQSQDSSANPAEDFNRKNERLVVFCAANVDIIKGDYIIASRADDSGNIVSTYEGRAGLPSQFATHKEVLLEEVRFA